MLAITFVVYYVREVIRYDRLRIEHFCRLYREAIRQSRSVTAQVLAEECGFHSYSTFSANFKRLKGETVTAWMACESSACSINHESNA